MQLFHGLFRRLAAQRYWGEGAQGGVAQEDVASNYWRLREAATRTPQLLRLAGVVGGSFFVLESKRDVGQ